MLGATMLIAICAYGQAQGSVLPQSMRAGRA